MEPKLYTTPPYTIPWPYIITNPRRRRWILSYLRRHRKNIESLIIDSGVEIFRSRAREYPGGPLRWFRKMLDLKKKISRTLSTEIWLVAPDYPADYPGAEIENNVERTLKVLREIEERYGTEGTMAVIQGKPIWEDPDLSKFKEYVEMYKAEEIFQKYEYIGLGTVCTLSSIRIRGIPEREAIRWIRRTVETARETIGNRKLHIFGLWLRALPAVKNAIYSFDSQAWTRPVSRRLKRNWSAKNTEERELYFRAWIRRYLSIVRQKTIL